MAVGSAPGTPPPEEIAFFIADHPFQFFIYDQAKTIVLFEGRLGGACEEQYILSSKCRAPPLRQPLLLIYPASVIIAKAP